MTDDLAPALAATRAERGLVALLVACTALAWWWTDVRMRGMDAGPWTGLGAFGWFLGIWVVMMAAMMVPSAIPTVAVYARLSPVRSLLSSSLFVAGYLAVWAATGLGAFAAATVGGRFAGGSLAWDAAGRWVAGATLLDRRPLRAHAAQGRVPRPLPLPAGLPARVVATRRPRRFPDGELQRPWCAGCCWALMASLFALGIMSHPLDGSRRGDRPGREGTALAAARGVGNRGAAARPRNPPACCPAGGSRAHDSGADADADADERLDSRTCRRRGARSYRRSRSVSPTRFRRTSSRSCSPAASRAASPTTSRISSCSRSPRTSSRSKRRSSSRGERVSSSGTAGATRRRRRGGSSAISTARRWRRSGGRARSPRSCSRAEGRPMRSPTASRCGRAACSPAGRS